MTAAEANAVKAMTVAQLMPFTLVSNTVLQNHLAQRDDAIARIQAADANRAALLKAHADAVTAKEQEKADAVAAKEAEKAAALAAAQIELAAKEAAIAEKAARIAELKAYVDAVANEPRARELAKEQARAALVQSKADAEAAAAKAQADLDALEK